MFVLVAGKPVIIGLRETVCEKMYVPERDCVCPLNEMENEVSKFLKLIPIWQVKPF